MVHHRPHVSSGADLEVADPTFLALVPALVAIGLAFTTRQVLPSLFLGIVSGGIVKWSVSGEIADANFITQFFLPALGSESYAKILLIYLWSLGGLLGIWERTGGALHFANVVGGRVAKGPRSSLLFAWFLGCVFHQGGTVSTVLAGTTVKPVSDKHRVSHEELAYVVDSTASPIATVLPFNAWPVFIAGLVAGSIPLIPDMETGVTFFISSIKYNFYGIFAVVFTGLFAAGWLPWIGGRMSAARKRARETGELDAPGAEPMLPTDNTDIDVTDNREGSYQPSLVDFLAPIGVLMGLAIGPYVLFDQNWINEAFLACTLTAMGVAIVRGMKVKDVLDGFLEGCKSMTVGAVILGLAITIGKVSQDLNTAGYLVNLIGSSFPAVALPATLTGLCMIMAFSTGTSWGTYAVVFPVALPLAYALNPDPAYIQLCFGAVLGGSVFGDQCSPISDTTILSSMFTGCDLMHHVTTQLPLALAAATLGGVIATGLAATM